jgi:subtilase family serine protease
MFPLRGSGFLTTALLLTLAGGCADLKSATPAPDDAAPARIRQRISENRLVTLGGNTRPEAVPENDLGVVNDELVIEHMMLQLQRSPEQEQAAQQLIADLHDPASPSFHKWLTPDEYGARFGVAESDLRTVTQWLESHGFTVNTVYPNGTVIDFSGTAGQVRNAFHTTIHNLNVAGEQHMANMTDPRIPEALAPIVAGVVSLHDFRPHHMARPAPAAARARNTESSEAKYTFTFGSQTYQAMVPADLAAIYDFNPLFAKGITGKGQTVVLIEDTNLYKTADWTTFRSVLGLSQYTSGNLVTVQPAPLKGSACGSPGINGDDVEAALDVEWASAAAPDATIELASCANTGFTSGLYLATQNLVNSSSPPAIVSISYGQCEAVNGASGNLASYQLYQQAVAEGISIFVSSGDEGAASCDAGASVATHGIGVSGLASTPYDVAVGGTDFSDVYSGTSGQYWSATNSATYGSALSYIPEIPWNDSCAGSLIASNMGYSTVYGTNSFCNTSAAISGGFLTVGGGSGGPSNCATGTPSIPEVASGTCQGWPKPSWQTGVAGMAADGVRDIPDVSMFASDGTAWGHYAVICFSDTTSSFGGAPCKGAPVNWSGVGGTSLAAPIVAGIQALVNQNAGGAQGNPNPVYYAMAVKVPGAFHPITKGDIDVNCNGPRNCYGLIGNLDYGRAGRIFATTYGGALSSTSATFTPAYAAGGNWNFATGLGSLDAYNLVMNWGAK